ncbi:unnamed protein product, partial [marine sediment metagenome]
YDNTATNKLADKYARWFFVPANQISLSLFQGKTTGQAYADSQYGLQYGIDYWKDSEDQIAPQMLACLYQNKNSQKVLGSESATITPNQRFSPPKLPIEGAVVQAGFGGLAALALIGAGILYLIKGGWK